MFSRVTASITKAKVTVTKASAQIISHNIYLNGTIEARDHFLQYVPAGLSISSIRVSPGENIEKGDVLFIIDVRKLQEEIETLEAEITSISKKDELTISRAEENYQNTKATAEEQIAMAYRDYADAEQAYNEYVNNHIIIDSEENAGNEDSEYSDMHVTELEELKKVAWDTYETILREQTILVESAEDALQQTKEDIALEQSTKKAEDRIKKLEFYAYNGGQFLSEYSGIVSNIFVQPGVATTEGTAVLISDSTDGVRLSAVLPEEYRAEITANSTITLTGIGLTGEQMSYTVSDIDITNDSDSKYIEEKGYKLSAMIPGDIYMVGSNISVNIKNKSEEYNTCIPLAALRQSGNYQYFIYIVQEQETVLGKEMIAKEMMVTVLDKNEKYVAVEEMISENVIVSSNKDISDGSKVMIVEK